MVHLSTVGGAFHARLVAARLGAEGIVTELRGSVDGPYPSVGPVDVYVTAEQVDTAREILLADAVDAAFDDVSPLGSEGPSRVDHQLRARAAQWWQSLLALAVLVALTTVLVAHSY
jgi:hypothetical protein